MQLMGKSGSTEKKCKKNELSALFIVAICAISNQIRAKCETYETRQNKTKMVLFSTNEPRVVWMFKMSVHILLTLNKIEVNYHRTHTK